jgi:hypothetical protein
MTAFLVDDIEKWLLEHGAQVRTPTRRDFYLFFDEWRRAFEPLFAAYHPTATDVVAMDLAERELPFDAELFCVPGYKFAPGNTAHPFFAFNVSGLRAINRELFNAHDVIVASKDLRFCCLYTHEIGALAEPAFWNLLGPGRALRPLPARGGLGSPSSRRGVRR